MLGRLVAGVCATLLGAAVVAILALLGQRPDIVAGTVEHVPIEIHQAIALSAAFGAATGTETTRRRLTRTGDGGRA